MICNRCGKEFGSGAVCQYCGTDKVSALGEFVGYSVPKKNANIEPSTSADPSPSHVAFPRMDDMSSLFCWNCEEEIPGDSKYCPVCGTLLFVNCPNCGHKYSAKYLHCNQCGTNREEYLKGQELDALARQLEEKKRKEEEELQRKRQEEARRQAEPKITLFTGDIRGNSVDLRWKTENVDYCELSWYEKREKCWYQYIESYYSSLKFVDLPSNSNCHTFSADELLYMVLLESGTERSICMCLEAFSSNGASTDQYLIIKVRTFRFSPLQVTSIIEDTTEEI